MNMYLILLSLIIHLLSGNFLKWNLPVDVLFIFPSQHFFSRVESISCLPELDQY